MLIVLAAVCGFMAGAAIAASPISRDAGLAGAAELVFYGAAGAVVGGAAAGYLGAVAGRKSLWLAAAALALILLLLFGRILVTQPTVVDADPATPAPRTVTEPPLAVPP